MIFIKLIKKKESVKIDPFFFFFVKLANEFFIIFSIKSDQKWVRIDWKKEREDRKSKKEKRRVEGKLGGRVGGREGGKTQGEEAKEEEKEEKERKEWKWKKNSYLL